MTDSVLGRWYAKEPSRYYQIVSEPPKEVTAYKMFIHSVDEEKGLVTYDSFLLINKTEIRQSKVDRVAKLKELLIEIDAGFLVRER